MWNGTEDKIKVKITWIRHGMTQANGEHRYLGKTDEPLSETGIHLLQEKKKEYFSSPPEFLYTSPMKRCVQTAELLFERNPILIPEWKEMDFGQFEGKNYEELKDALQEEQQMRHRLKLMRRHFRMFVYVQQ